jgi:hypothetical protein
VLSGNEFGGICGILVQKYHYQRNLEWNSYPIFHIEAYVICQWYPTHLLAAIPLRLHFVDNVKVHTQRATLGATV